MMARRSFSVAARQITSFNRFQLKEFIPLAFSCSSAGEDEAVSVHEDSPVSLTYWPLRKTSCKTLSSP